MVLNNMIKLNCNPHFGKGRHGTTNNTVLNLDYSPHTDGISSPVPEFCSDPISKFLEKFYLE
jgi:hypothetical protein